MRKVLSILFLTFSFSIYAQDGDYANFFPGAGPTVKAIVLDQQDCFDGIHKNNSLFTVKVIDDFGQELPDTMVLTYPMWYFCQDREYWEYALDSGRVNINYNIQKGKKYYFSFIKIRSNYEMGRFFEIKYGRTYCGKGYGFFTELKEKMNIRGMSTVRFEHLLKKSLRDYYQLKEQLKKSESWSYGVENGFVFVDLGLSVKWADYNIGAEKPEDYGDYFAWGEIEPYYDAGYAQENPQTHWNDNKAAGYDMPTYKYCKGSTMTLTKYCNMSEYGYDGFVDNKTTLDAEDDVAHVKWGGHWRMPTKEELEELRDSCTWVFTTRNDVKGYVVSSKKAGYTDRSIFLPYAGNRIDTNLYNAGVEFGLWSSTINTDRPGLAWMLFSGVMDCIGRGFGISVRPVCPK